MARWGISDVAKELTRHSINFYNSVIAVLCSHKINTFEYNVGQRITALQGITNVNLNAARFYFFAALLWLQRKAAHLCFVSVLSQYSVHSQKKPQRYSTRFLLSKTEWMQATAQWVSDAFTQSDVGMLHVSVSARKDQHSVITYKNCGPDECLKAHTIDWKLTLFLHPQTQTNGQS